MSTTWATSPTTTRVVLNLSAGDIQTMEIQAPPGASPAQIEALTRRLSEHFGRKVVAVATA